LRSGISGPKLDIENRSFEMAPRTSPGVILIVEDPSIRRLVKNVLRRGGYKAIECDVEQALRSLAGGEASVMLLITNRPEAFAYLDGSVPLLYLASAPDWELAARTRGMRVLQKPFHTKELLDAVGEITEG
jgi:DNA-binding response OmpR family regulator